MATAIPDTYAELYARRPDEHGGLVLPGYAVYSDFATNGDEMWNRQTNTRPGTTSVYFHLITVNGHTNILATHRPMRWMPHPAITSNWDGYGFVLIQDKNPGSTSPNIVRLPDDAFEVRVGIDVGVHRLELPTGIAHEELD